jgi:hypothetical protein
MVMLHQVPVPALTPNTGDMALRPLIQALEQPGEAHIMAILAHREIHWQITLPAIYFLLSLTVLISRLLIIIGIPHF